MMKYFLVMFYGFVVGYDLLLGVIRLTEGNPWGWLFVGFAALFIVGGSWVIWLSRNEDELKLYQVMTETEERELHHTCNYDGDY